MHHLAWDGRSRSSPLRTGILFCSSGATKSALHDLAIKLEAHGVAATALALKLESGDAVIRIVETLASNGQYCDILINGAGFGVFGSFAEAKNPLQLALIDVNIRVVTALIAEFLPGMIERRRGGIINIGSITGYAPGPYMATYCASKAYIRSFTAALAAEVAGTGVTVTCLTPGVVRTAFFDRQPMEQRQSKLLKILPRGDAAHAAKAAWLGFKAGKSIVVPRFIDQFAIAVCAMLPDRALARMVVALQRSR